MGSLSGMRVFISYPRGGLAHTWAERLQRDLEARGAQAWRDETDVAQGDSNWYRRISEALDRADVVACVLGRESECCRWQQREILYADRLTTPVVVLRTADVALPFALIEKQPVEARDGSSAPEILGRLAKELGRYRQCSPEVVPEEPTDTARRREVAWLQDLLHGDISDREKRYVEIAGQESSALGAERTLKSLRMPTTMLLQAFGLKESQLGQEQELRSFDDVLDAYRNLPSRPVKRIVVLGEPGAGKTFSLERIACEYARAALRDPARPLPLLVRLGLWTRDEPLQVFIEQQLGDLGSDFLRLRDAGRAVLLLDAANEIPPGQRRPKVLQIRRMAEDDRFAAVVLSCRERDFEADLRLPFDRLTLQPLTPPQIRRFIGAAFSLGLDREAAEQRTEERFWRIAGGDDLREVWQTWEQAGASFEQFWSVDDVPRADPDVYSRTSGRQDQRWKQARSGRGLMSLAGNPYLLEIMMRLPVIPPNRAQLFDGFIRVLHQRELEARDLRHERTPGFDEWRAVLVSLADALQRVDGSDQGGGARTALPQEDWPAALTALLVDFSIDASVLQRVGDSLRFTHQLLQESLAAGALLDAAGTGRRPASDFWPKDRWWQRSGWEVVGEIAAEACEGDSATQVALIRWLAADQPGVALDVWRHMGRPRLPRDLLEDTASQWGSRLTDEQAEPNPEARASIGRWLGALDLDHRPGTGLRDDGTPDIDWVVIDDDRPFVYQDQRHAPLPAFGISRHPVTNRQWQAFVDESGYKNDVWWEGLAQRMDPEPSTWDEPTAPRTDVSWFEAVAFCRWLSSRLQQAVTLPTEVQWERAARGLNGLEFPWGQDWEPDRLNAEDRLQRTMLVGQFPSGASPDCVLDMAGNVWEWSLNEYEQPENTSLGGDARRVLRGGSWGSPAEYCRASYRCGDPPGDRGGDLGLRLVLSGPIRGSEP